MTTVFLTDSLIKDLIFFFGRVSINSNSTPPGSLPSSQRLFRILLSHLFLGPHICRFPKYFFAIRVKTHFHRFHTTFMFSTTLITPQALDYQSSVPGRGRASYRHSIRTGFEAHSFSCPRRSFFWLEVTLPRSWPHMSAKGQR
jgi:hypothetical protein